MLAFASGNIILTIPWTPLRYDTFYNLTLRYRNGKSRKERESSASLPLEKFFDTDGVLQYERLQRDVMKLHANIQAKME